MVPDQRIKRSGSGKLTTPQNGKSYQTPILRAGNVYPTALIPIFVTVLIAPNPTNLKRSDARFPNLPKNSVYEIIGVRIDQK